MWPGSARGKRGISSFIVPPTGLNILPPPPIRIASAVIGQVASRLFDYIFHLNFAQVPCNLIVRNLYLLHLPRNDKDYPLTDVGDSIGGTL
jgi:hypothetical protein